MPPTPSSRRAVVVAVSVALSLASFFALQSPSHARTSARKLFERAKKAYVEARVEASTRLLRRAAKRARDGKLAAQIELYLALNLLVTKQDERAKAALLRALRLDPTLTLDRARFKPSTVAILDGIRMTARGTLVVTANRPGKVWIDGLAAGATPLTTKVAIGKHRVEVRAGKVRYEQGVIINIDAHLSVSANLPEAPTTTVPPPVAASPPASGQAAVAAAGPDPGGVADKPRGARRLWTWIALGTAAAAAGVGIALAVSAKSDHSEHQSTLDFDRFASLEDSARAKALGANILFVGAGVIAAGAVALFFIEGRARPRDDRNDGQASALRIVPSAGPGGGAVRLDLKF